MSPSPSADRSDVVMHHRAAVDKSRGRLYQRGAAPGPRSGFGGVAKRSTAADCKSADFGLRRFESFPLHHALKRNKINHLEKDYHTRQPHTFPLRRLYITYTMCRINFHLREKVGQCVSRVPCS